MIIALSFLPYIHPNKKLVVFLSAAVEQHIKKYPGLQTHSGSLYDQEQEDVKLGHTAE